MAVGDLLASTPVFCATETAVKAAVDALNLTETTDNLHVVAWRTGVLVFKVERAGA